jgi:hypothetical protein
MDLTLSGHQGFMLIHIAGLQIVRFERYGRNQITGYEIKEK